MIKKKAVELFAKSFFGDTDDEILSIINDITHLKSIEKREMLFFEGDQGNHVFFMTEGSIKLFKSNPEGKEAVIRFIEPGDLFAEILLFLKNRYPVSAMAIKPSTLLAIDATKLFTLIKTNPDVAMKLIAKMASRSQYLVKMVENLTLTDARERFLNYLRHLSEESGSLTITLPVPKGELAMLLGVAPETFSRLLNKLADEGVVVVDGKKITLIDEPGVG